MSIVAGYELEQMVGDPDGLVDSPGMRLPVPISVRASLSLQF